MYSVNINTVSQCILSQCTVSEILSEILGYVQSTETDASSHGQWERELRLT